MSQIDLSKILTPEFLDAYRRANIPFQEDQPLDFNAVTKLYFVGEPDLSVNLYQLTFHALLKPGSTLGVGNIPDLMQFLPPADAPHFPAQALGLIMLFDQATRMTLRGANERYVTGYFDLPVEKLARKLFALPKEQRPDSMARMMAQGWSYDYAMAARIWLIAPLVHSEHIEDQERQQEIVEGWRSELEEHVGRADPHRKTAKEDSNDIYAFSRILSAGPPVHEGITLEEYMFYVFRLFRIHTPLVRKFGRYPHRNPIMGRKSTAEEERFAKETNYFGFERDPELAENIRRDVEAGVWNPLHDQADFETR